MSPHTNTLILSITLLVTCLSSSNADLIGDVCAKASNPPSCDKILRSDPLAGQAHDIPSLGSVTIDLADALSKSAQALADSLAKTTTDPNLQGSLVTCSRNFGYAMVNLEVCKKALQVNDIATLSGNALTAYGNANTCNDNFQGLVEPPNVKQATEDSKDACNAIVAISKLL